MTKKKTSKKVVVERYYTLEQPVYNSISFNTKDKATGRVIELVLSRGEQRVKACDFEPFLEDEFFKGRLAEGEVVIKTKPSDTIETVSI